MEKKLFFVRYNGYKHQYTHSVASYVASEKEALEAWKANNYNSSFAKGYEDQFSFTAYAIDKGETGYAVLKNGSPFREGADVLVKVDEQTCVIYNTVEDAAKVVPITELVRLSIPVWGRSKEEEEAIEADIQACFKRGLELI